jgi:hypothetical protein
MERSAAFIVALLIGAAVLVESPAVAKIGTPPRTPSHTLERLVADVSVNPSPFYPLVRDGYKDITRIRFSLASDSTATFVRIFRSDSSGRCCGKEVRTDDLGPRSAGFRRSTWDGTRDDGSAAPKGNYFVKVEATDASAVATMSKAQKVQVTRGVIRRTAVKTKAGGAYARQADERPTALGGDCLVSRDPTARAANVLCANAAISVYWKWQLRIGERIEKAWFAIDGGFYGCHRKKGSTKTESYLRVTSPPTSTCSISKAKITYSYPVQV